MPKFFDDAFSTAHPILTGEHHRHIGLSLRMRAGESLTVCSGGMDYACTIEEITADTVFLRIDGTSPCDAEPTIRTVLFQALPKADKLEQIIQKAVELGVTEIVPVLTSRCVSRMKPQEFQKKLPRYQKIAQAAAEQSGRGMIPQVGALCSLKQAATQMAALDVKAVLYEAEGGCSFTDLPADARSYGIFVGSEGGFDPQEIAFLQQAGMQTVWLGRRILRCETAPLAALSVLMYRTGNLN